jgi:DNA polymerase-3 subunit delta
MPEISYKELPSHLEDLRKGRKGDPFDPVYLIYGDEFLCKAAFEELLNAMLPSPSRGMNFEPVDGIDEDIHEVIERVNTYSLLPGTKVVAVLESRIFHSTGNAVGLIEKIKEASDRSDIKTAARCLVGVLGLLNLTYDDMRKAEGKKKLKIDGKSSDEGNWLDEVIAYCMDNNLSIPAGKDSAGVLNTAIEKGFPEGNHLVITAEDVDKRLRLFQTIAKKGMIVDCSVPKGDRHADKIAQEAVLSEKMKTILAQSQKTMERSAYEALYEMTGFDLRTFCNDLEKLVNYVGDRKKITGRDVEFVLRRTKKDPVYELTNAVSDRNAQSALFFLNSLMSAGVHPLQILAAITNQIRKLLLVKDFTESPYGSPWRPDFSYGHFKSHILPAIQSYDRVLLNQLDNWESMLLEKVDADDKNLKKRRSRKNQSATDLLIAKNPGNPYPIYQILLKSGMFTKDDLCAAMECLSDADSQLKSSGRNPKLVLEAAIFSICRKKGDLGKSSIMLHCK